MRKFVFSLIFTLGLSMIESGSAHAYPFAYATVGASLAKIDLADGHVVEEHSFEDIYLEELSWDVEKRHFLISGSVYDSSGPRFHYKSITFDPRTKHSLIEDTGRRTSLDNRLESQIGKQTITVKDKVQVTFNSDQIHLKRYQPRETKLSLWGARIPTPSGYYVKGHQIVRIFSSENESRVYVIHEVSYLPLNERINFQYRYFIDVIETSNGTLERIKSYPLPSKITSIVFEPFLSDLKPEMKSLEKLSKQFLFLDYLFPDQSILFKENFTLEDSIQPTNSELQNYLPEDILTEFILPKSHPAQVSAFAQVSHYFRTLSYQGLSDEEWIEVLSRQPQEKRIHLAQFLAPRNPYFFYLVVDSFTRGVRGAKQDPSVVEEMKRLFDGETFDGLARMIEERHLSQKPKRGWRCSIL